MSHRCPSCETRIPDQYAFCRPHWFAIPKPLRDRIWASWNRLQDLRGLGLSDEASEQWDIHQQLIREAAEGLEVPSDERD